MWGEGGLNPLPPLWPQLELDARHTMFAFSYYCELEVWCWWAQPHRSKWHHKHKRNVQERDTEPSFPAAQPYFTLDSLILQAFVSLFPSYFCYGKEEKHLEQMTVGSQL